MGYDFIDFRYPWVMKSKSIHSFLLPDFGARVRRTVGKCHGISLISPLCSWMRCLVFASQSRANFQHFTPSMTFLTTQF